MRLQGKVAIATGAGGGIGAAICRRFAAEGAALIGARKRELTKSDEFLLGRPTAHVQHKTARVHRAARRCGGCVAAEARVGGTQSHRRRYSIPTNPPRATL